MGGKVAPGGGEAAQAASCRVLVRGGTDEGTGEILSAAMVAERAGWCAGLVRGMAGRLPGGHWNAGDVADLASGRDGAGRALPAPAWMALRRLGWAAAPPDGVTVNDRVVRMAQEQAGRVLRSACPRAALTAGILPAWPVQPSRRTPEERDAVRGAVPGGKHLPSSVITARTRQAGRFLEAGGRLPGDVFGLEAAPRAAGSLLLHACDRQQATIERSGTDPGRVLLRVRLPLRPDPQGYRDWARAACPLTLPPTVPAGAVLHLPALRVADGKAWGMGRTLNTRLSQAVRGKITVRIRHLAAEHGIAVVTVPARGTSKCCPRCLAPLRHCKAPGRPSDPGWKWARCPDPECGRQGDRDQGAWMRIASRGLARQHKTAIDRAAATMAVRSAGHTLEPAAVITPRAPGRDRSKAGPTRRRAARPAPRRRGAPSPVRPPGRTGQRPEGHATTARPLPRAARRDQGASTTSTPIHRPHRARGAALGAGFHLHAHATPPRWETIPEPSGLTEDHSADQRRFP